MNKSISEKKEAVRQFIVRAVPSVMDLQFGCVFTYGKTSYLNGTVKEPKKGTYIRRNSRNMVEFKTQEEGHSNITEDNIIEIIGRPITLADVLVAIKKKIGVQDSYYSINMSGEIIKNDRETAVIDEVAFWDLSQDFDHQSEETYNFLWSLLCE